MSLLYQNLSVLPLPAPVDVTPTPTPPPPAPPPPSPVPSGFVTRSGANLMCDNKIFKFAAFNDFSLTGCHTGAIATVAQCDQLMGAIRPKSVIRTWAFSHSSSSGIARVIERANFWGHKIMLVLHEGAGHCGSPGYDANWYKSGYSGAYFTHIRNIVPIYKDNPAVMWEISNEPGHAGNPAITEAEMKNFLGDSAELIKSLDPNHVISTGCIGSWKPFHMGESGYYAVHDNPAIDLVSSHEYEYDYNGNTGVQGRHAQELRAAVALGKPIFIGEVGCARTIENTSLQRRADVFKLKCDAYLNNSAAGVLYWTLTIPPNTQGNSAGLAANDSYTSPVVLMQKDYTHSALVA